MVVRPGYRELWELVRDQLRDDLISGALPPGARLTETELAERFDVSRGPVRTALADLERVGLVVPTPRRGLEVASFSRRDIDELHDLHEMLERHSLVRAAPEFNDHHAARLGAILDRLEEADARNDPATAVEADLEFHRSLAGLCGNGRLMATWDLNAEQIRVLIATVQRADHSVAAGAGEHRVIVDALARSDVDAALAAHRRHFEASRRVMATLVAEQERAGREGASSGPPAPVLS